MRKKIVGIGVLAGLVVALVVLVLTIVVEPGSGPKTYSAAQASDALVTAINASQAADGSDYQVARTKCVAVVNGKAAEKGTEFECIVDVRSPTQNNICAGVAFPYTGGDVDLQKAQVQQVAASYCQ